MSQNPTPSIPAGLTFPETSQLTDLQAHMRKLCDHFGWHMPPEKKFLLLTEEIGELAKAIRKMEKITVDTQQMVGKTPQDLHDNLAEELADMFSYLMDIANSYDIDLGQAYTEKMSANFSRSWE